MSSEAPTRGRLVRMSSSTGRGRCHRSQPQHRRLPTPPLSKSPTALLSLDRPATTLPAARSSLPPSLLSQNAVQSVLSVDCAFHILQIGINLECVNARGKREGELDTKGEGALPSRTQSLWSMGRAAGLVRRAGPGRRSGGWRPALSEQVQSHRGTASRAASHSLKPPPPPSAPQAATSAPSRAAAKRAVRGNPCDARRKPQAARS